MPEGGYALRFLFARVCSGTGRLAGARAGGFRVKSAENNQIWLSKDAGP